MKEYLSKKINDRIEKISENIQSLPHRQISNEEWLDREEFRRIGKERYSEKFLRIKQ